MRRQPLLAMLLAVMLIAPVEVAAAAPAAGPEPAGLARTGRVAELRPEIRWRPIPYGARRKRQMAAYSQRHYGQHTWRLRSPQAVVEHYTTGTRWQSAWNWFASNTRHNGERPGTCAHFLIDRDGTIRQLVPLWVRCRHAVGMNHLSIGIEHVGTSDRMVLDNPRQMRASLRLTRWLMARFGVGIGNVIGHRETLESPLRYELDPDWRCLVHADFPHRAMREYRTRLRVVLARRGVPAGRGPRWVDPHC
ncbi:MAG TPA: peptidoglycan recognition family protein [Actinomycetota bacterium]|jgi:hypothetical protein